MHASPNIRNSYKFQLSSEIFRFTGAANIIYVIFQLIKCVRASEFDLINRKLFWLMLLPGEPFRPSGSEIIKFINSVVNLAVSANGARLMAESK